MAEGEGTAAHDWIFHVSGSPGSEGGGRGVLYRFLADLPPKLCLYIPIAQKNGVLAHAREELRISAQLRAASRSKWLVLGFGGAARAHAGRRQDGTKLFLVQRFGIPV